MLASSIVAQKLTRDNGRPIGDNQNSQTAGQNGPALLQESHLIEKLQGSSIVNAYPSVWFMPAVLAPPASLFRRKFFGVDAGQPVCRRGKKTPVFVRFSTVMHGNGSPETLPDPSGFATKFYTDQGNWDLVGNNLPIFFIRDAIKFPDMVHSLKPSHPRSAMCKI